MLLKSLIVLHRDGIIHRMKVLITGAAGFIGSFVTKFLAREGHEVFALDALIDSTYPASIKKRRWFEMKQSLPQVRFINLSLLDKNFYKRLDDIDAIVNLAAIPGLDLSWNNLRLYTDNNIAALQNLLNFTKESDAKLLHISTSSVYGKNAIGKEEEVCNPVSPYGVSKLAAENLIRAYSLNYEIDFSIFRLFSVFGPGQRPDMGYEKFIHAIIDDEEIEIYGDGLQSRSNTYVQDCAAAINLGLSHSLTGETYNIAGEETYNVLEILETLSAILEKKYRPLFSKKRAGDQLATHGNTDKARRELGWRPTCKLEIGLEAQINHCLTGHDFRDITFF